MSNYQPGILQTEIPLARYLTFSVVTVDDITSTLRVLAAQTNGDDTVVGIGQSLVAALGRNIDGLRVLPVLTGSAIEIPSTPAALWVWLRGNDRGKLFHRSRQIESLLLPNFSLDDVLDCFPYDVNRDLAGYEDGTVTGLDRRH